MSADESALLDVTEMPDARPLADRDALVHHAGRMYIVFAHRSNLPT